MSTSEISELDTLSPTLEKILEDAPPRPKKVIVCNSCNHLLADAGDQHQILGSHEHEFMNPYGLLHRFRCFRNALGCAIKGHREFADSWFPGYTWRIATCGQCDTHIGWLFEGSDSFYGLLVQKIVTMDLDENS